MDGAQSGGRAGTWLQRNKAVAAAAGTALVMGAVWAGTAIGQSDGSSKVASPTAESAGAPCGHVGRMGTMGEVASVSGNTIKVKGPHGDVTVQVNESTTYLRSVTAAKSDLSVGKTVAVMPDGPPNGSASVTAGGVVVDPPDRGDEGRGAHHMGLTGQITAVGADTIKVKANGREVTVKLTDSTKYRRFEKAALGDVKAGERIAVHSATLDRPDGGTITAKSIVIGVPEPEGGHGFGPPAFHQRFGPGGQGGAGQSQRRQGHWGPGSRSGASPSSGMPGGAMHGGMMG